MKYIDAEKLIAEIQSAKSVYSHPNRVIHGIADAFRQDGRAAMCDDILTKITSLQQEQDMGEVSDGYHTFNELYYYRMLYNAAFFNHLPKGWVHKSKRHNTGEECFGGGWFIVMANLPTGQISNHYELKDWDLFKVPEKEFADKWDGHTPQEAAKRLYEYLQQEQPDEQSDNIGKLEASPDDVAMIENILGTYKTLEDMLDLTTSQDRDILESMNFERGWLKRRFGSTASPELEEEIARFEEWMETYNQSDYPTSYTTKDIARHFAEWQRQKMEKEAVEVEVANIGILQMGDLLLENGIQAGENVKLIILKEDE